MAEALIKSQFSNIWAEGDNNVTPSVRMLQKKMQMESNIFVEILLTSSNAYKAYYGLRKAFRSEGTGSAYPVRCCVVEGQRLLMPDVKTDVEAAFFRLRLVTKKGLTCFGGLYAVNFEERTYTLYNVQYLEVAAGEEDEVLKGRELVMVQFDEVQELTAAYIPLTAVLDSAESCQDLSSFLETHAPDVSAPINYSHKLAVASTVLQLRPFFPYTARRLVVEMCKELYFTRDLKKTMKHRMLLPFLLMKQEGPPKTEEEEEEETPMNDETKVLNDPAFRLFLKRKSAAAKAPKELGKAGVNMSHAAVPFPKPRSSVAA